MKGSTVIHLLIVCEFMHHDHLHELEWQPPAGRRRFKDKLYDFAIIEIAT
jgi:hypothetical protein